MADTEPKPVEPTEEVPTEPTSPVETPEDDVTPEDDEQPVDPIEEDPENPAGDDQPENPDAAAPAPVETPAAPDYKEKFASSARRNQVVEAQNEELQQIVRDITKEDRPTDDEMRAADPDWDLRSDFEKNLAVKVEAQGRAAKRVDAEMRRITIEGKRKLEIARIIDTEPRLKGREEAFEKFSQDPRNSLAPATVLLNAFLFDAGEAAPAPTPAPAPKPKGVPPALQRGNPSGGRPPTPRKPGEFSPEDLKNLRTTDPKRYNEMIRKGQIK